MIGDSNNIPQRSLEYESAASAMVDRTNGLMFVSSRDYQWNSCSDCSSFRNIDLSLVAEWPVGLCSSDLESVIYFEGLTFTAFRVFVSH